MVFYCVKSTYNGGGGELCTILGNSGHGLALCHVFDMSFVGIVQVAASYGREPESEISQRYLSRRQSFNDDARMHLGR